MPVADDQAAQVAQPGEHEGHFLFVLEQERPRLACLLLGIFQVLLGHQGANLLLFLLRQLVGIASLFTGAG